MYMYGCVCTTNSICTYIHTICDVKIILVVHNNKCLPLNIQTHIPLHINTNMHVNINKH